jgi:hypothetical protein
MRLLSRGRQAIFRNLLARELEVAVADQRLEACVAVFKKALRQPRRVADLVEEAPADLREALGEFLARFQASLPQFRGDRSERGRELERGLELILG